jgi:TolB protein
MDIYTMNADGSGQINLSNNEVYDLQPSWSPDGNTIAFVSYGEGNGSREIYVMNADGTEQTRLTDDPADDEEPSWSPNGRKIVFTRYGGTGKIYVMNADGTELAALTRGITPDWQALPLRNPTPEGSTARTFPPPATVDREDL